MSGPREPHSIGDTTFQLSPSESSAEERLWLVVIGDGRFETHALPRAGEVVIGRAHECDVLVQDPSVSRRHASISIGPSLRVHDLGSSNGVRLRGQKLAPHGAAEFAPGDVVELGSVTLVLQRGQRPGTPATAPSLTPSSPIQAPPAHSIPPPPPVAPALFTGSAAAGAAIAPGGSAEGPFVGDPALARIHELIHRIRASTINVLLLGETGVGKEVIAEAVHRSSVRAHRPFVRLNCAALSPTLLESELFGHEKGAFTGAVAAKAGLLESAEGGTVFIDEVGELPTEVQVKLLRVLEERMVLRVGALRPRPIDVRFVSATNRDLRTEATRGTFRLDLFYRLNGISIQIPPLRERRVEIEGLAQRFITRVSASLGVAPPALSPAALDALMTHRWPGNIRELRNEMERAVLLAGSGPIELEHLSPELLAGIEGDRPSEPSRASAPSLAHTAPPGDASRTPRARTALQSELEAVERARIAHALEQCGGNQTRAAEFLGMPRRTLVAKIKSLGLPQARRRDG